MQRVPPEDWVFVVLTKSTQENWTQSPNDFNEVRKLSLYYWISSMLNSVPVYWSVLATLKVSLTVTAFAKFSAAVLKVLTLLTDPIPSLPLVPGSERMPLSFRNTLIALVFQHQFQGGISRDTEPLGRLLDSVQERKCVSSFHPPLRGPGRRRR